MWQGKSQKKAAAPLSPSKEQNEKQFLNEMSTQQEEHASPRSPTPVLLPFESLQLNLLVSQDDELDHASPPLDVAGQSHCKQQTTHQPRRSATTPSPFASPNHQRTSPMHLRFSSSPEDYAQLTRNRAARQWLFDPYTGKPQKGKSCSWRGSCEKIWYSVTLKNEQWVTSYAILLCCQLSSAILMKTSYSVSCNKLQYLLRLLLI